MISGRETPRILIVEDEHMVALSLKMLIECTGRGRIVGIADDVASASRLLSECEMDMALVDIQLARGASGFDVARTIRSHGIPAFFMTGNSPAKPAPELVLGCLCKPFSDAALFAAIQLGAGLLDRRQIQCSLIPELILYDEVANGVARDSGDRAA